MWSLLSGLPGVRGLLGGVGVMRLVQWAGLTCAVLAGAKGGTGGCRGGMPTRDRVISFVVGPNWLLHGSIESIRTGTGCILGR